mmetsp:Transcript_11224/g.18058  ORF Transcript_11224/g.18058 Transcript_11224/m.18058 type:complete len:222 (+) Transcript_11224:857-1522(+)
MERLDEVQHEHLARFRTDAKGRSDVANQAVHVHRRDGPAAVVEGLKRVYVLLQDLRRQLPLFVLLHVLEVFDNDRGEQVEQDHRHDDDKGDEERVCCPRPTVAGGQVAVWRLHRAVLHQPHPLVVGRYSEQREHRHLKRLEVGVLVEADPADGGAEGEHAHVAVDEEEQQHERPHVPERGERHQQRLEQTFQPLEGFDEAKHATDAEEPNDAHEGRREEGE